MMKELRLREILSKFGCEHHPAQNCRCAEKHKEAFSQIKAWALSKLSEERHVYDEYSGTYESEQHMKEQGHNQAISTARKAIENE